MKAKKLTPTMIRIVGAGFWKGGIPDAEITGAICPGPGSEGKETGTILERSFGGDCVTTRIAHEDGLCRFGYAPVGWTASKSDMGLMVFGKISLSSESAPAGDLLCDSRFFPCRMYGLGSYLRQADQALSDIGTEKDIQKLD